MLELLRQTVYFGNSILEYSIAAALLIAGCLFLMIIRRVVLSRIIRVTGKTSSAYGDVIVNSIKNHVVPLAYFLLFYTCLIQLRLNSKLYTFLKAAILLICVFFVIRFLLSVIHFWLYNSWAARSGNISARKHVSSVIMNILRLALWVTGILLFLDNIGIKVSAFIAGLGVGGIAVAFAAQAVLQDIFSYFSIFFDNTFEIGDLIAINNIQGTVEHIGIKTTRIRSVTGEQIVVSNAALTGSELHNFKRMNERRATLNIGVVYDTEFDKLREIPGIIKNVIE
ncbi:MAG: mechanosensitive ion channel family protein, partial [Spirochaetia bacterium]|nr:mechanosensitive ion channel family protein [Spirochaetia bacterium]